jgi:hypothetical protein
MRFARNKNLRVFALKNVQEVFVVFEVVEVVGVEYFQPLQ